MITPDDSAAPATGWRDHWYPLALGRDLGPSEVRAISVHGERLALFRDRGGEARAVADRCPHRAARLSDGRVEGGRLECLYHGWQFGGDGRCLEIPQLGEDQPIPAKAHITSFRTVETQGMIWVWPGDGEADPGTIPVVEALEGEDCTSIDFAIDLPYEQTFLVENVIDIAHIHVAHDGVRGGGHRHLAAAMEFEISERRPDGFEGSFRSVGSGGAGSELRGARVDFVAPNLVHYRSLYHDDELVSGLALYSLPLGPCRCRLIYRAYSNFWPLRARLRPRWLEHWTQCTILEQDMGVVVGQAAEIEDSGQPPKALWLPLKSSDGFVLAYRRWLDEHARDWPHAVGFARLDPPTNTAPPAPFGRYEHHTQICADCSRVHQICRVLRTPLALLIVLCLAFAATTGPSMAWGVATLAVVAAVARWGVGQVARRFE